MPLFDIITLDFLELSLIVRVIMIDAVDLK